MALPGQPERQLVLMHGYDRETARHYAAYRPPLHAEILRRILPPETHFRAGLDVGCGTGQSTVALAAWCDRVIGWEPNPEMLARADSGTKKVCYRQMEDGAEWPPFADPVPEVVTFAGSLFYQKAEITYGRMRAGLPDGAVVIVYDFAVDLDPVFSAFSYLPPVSAYDHAKNFGKSANPDFRSHEKGTFELSFTASPSAVAHLICSVSRWRKALLPNKDFIRFTERIAARMGAELLLSARAFFHRYELLPVRGTA